MRDMDLLQFWLKGVIGGVSQGGCPACSGCLGTRTGMGLMHLPRVAVLLEPCTCTAVVRRWAVSVMISRPSDTTSIDQELTSAAHTGVNWSSEAMP